MLEVRFYPDGYSDITDSAEHRERLTALAELLRYAQETEDEVLTEADWEELAGIRALTNADLFRRTMI